MIVTQCIVALNVKIQRLLVLLSTNLPQYMDLFFCLFLFNDMVFCLFFSFYRLVGGFLFCFFFSLVLAYFIKSQV